MPWFGLRAENCGMPYNCDKIKSTAVIKLVAEKIDNIWLEENDLLKQAEAIEKHTTEDSEAVNYETSDISGL